MPTVLRIGPYRFFFYSNENQEPPHIHIQRDSALAKLWIGPVALVSSTGFPAHELSRLAQLTQQNEKILLEAWNDFFGAA